MNKRINESKQASKKERENPMEKKIESLDYGPGNALPRGFKMF